MKHTTVFHKYDCPKNIDEKTRTQSDEEKLFLLVASNPQNMKTKAWNIHAIHVINKEDKPLAGHTPTQTPSTKTVHKKVKTKPKNKKYIGTLLSSQTTC